MVSLKYPALYSDNLGCDKCYVYMSKESIELKIRGFSFYSENYDFDFYSRNKSEAQKNFYLKDNELINYVLDIRIKIPMIYNNKKHIEKAILRIERQKNLYNNMIIIDRKDMSCQAIGVNFKNLIFNLKNNLPAGYDIEDNIILINN
ncbi:DUF6304 family protein [uncultured Clostridium sp.]|uniref:DUF6304 family protein n=1 Tax=uncultured Clostridium sp. TaxID=59620 RepID=UPI0025D5F2D5|nr:DUF6304 family protein [uncultured Clostridium sp.]